MLGPSWRRAPPKYGPGAAKSDLWATSVCVATSVFALKQVLYRRSAWGLQCARSRTHLLPNAFVPQARGGCSSSSRTTPQPLGATNLGRSLGARARVITLPEGIKDLSGLAAVPHGRATFFQLVKDADRGEAAGDEA